MQDLDTNWLRNNVTLVQQSSILFNETIWRNIAFGGREFPKVTMKQIKVCIGFAALQSTIDEMPEGLETVVGSGGNALSGGQKQRVAMARARLRDTPVLILDESTSALDYTSRTAVVQAIREWRRGKTTVIITHDMAQIRDEDFVYVLDNGHITREGYRHRLKSSDNKGVFSPTALSPQISSRPCFDFDFGLRPILSNSRNIGAGQGVDDPWTPLAERDFIDVQLDAVAEDRSDRPYSIALVSNDSLRNTTRQRFSVTRAISIAIKRQSTTLSRSLDSHIAAPHQDSDLHQSTSFRIGAGTSRPMSMHQAVVMRSMYRQLSVHSRSDTDSSIPLTSQTRPQALPDVSVLENKQRSRLSMKEILQTLWPSLTSQKRWLLLFGFVAVLVHAAGIPVFSYIFSQLIETFFVKKDQARQALIYSMTILGVAVVDAIACFLSWYLLEAVGEAWIDKLRVEAITRVLQQPKVWFESELNSASSVTSSLDRNAEEMRNLVGRFAGLTVTVAAMMLIAVVWALITCWKLTLVGLAAGPLLYCIIRCYETVSSQWEARTNVASDIAESIFVETFSDIRTVRALTLESYFHKKYTKATTAALKVGIQRALYSGCFFGASDSAISFVTALIFWYGGNVVRSHDYSVKSILTVFAMLLFSTANAANGIAFIPQISSSIDCASRLLQLAKLPSRGSHEHSGKLKLDTNDPKTLMAPIRFINLTFSYPSRPDAHVLSNLNLTIENSQCTAIVGASGSGKSTIAALLLGLYSPAPSLDNSACRDTFNNLSSLTLSGHDIRTLHLPTLRSMISIVPQTPVLFATSIRTNITYGLELNSALTSLANIEYAAQKAGIHDFVASLPQGYDTVIGDGGLGLSGGQAQKIVIARALCRRPKILILDEATSALDGESACVVRQSILQLVKETGGITVIVITHSKDMMQCADNVVVLDQGRVAEEGHFQDLLRRKGRLWEMLNVGGVLAQTPRRV